MKTFNGIKAILGIILIIVSIIFGYKLLVYFATVEVMSLLITMPALGLIVVALIDWTFKNIYKNVN